MIAVTMNDAVFVLVEDPAVPVVDGIPPPSPDVPLANAEQAPPPPPPPIRAAPMEDEQPRPHRRTNFVIIKPPESLELLLQQLKAKWTPVRQSVGTGGNKQGVGQTQVTIDGAIFSIGADWIVRAGNIMIAGGVTRGMLLEVKAQLKR